MLCGWITLENIAHVAAIATAGVALVAYCRYQNERSRKIKRLVDYLRDQKKKNVDKGQRTLIHLIRHVGMTEAELLNASFENKNIDRRVKEDDDGDAHKIYLEYVGKL